ncbi:MAG: FAD-dependent oxidoreductase, partial [Caldilineaceae bacterium]
QSLAAAGHRVTRLDKGRSVGGRLATRAIGPGLADYGAQFFTVRQAPFRRQVERWQADGLVYIWGTGWSDGSLVTTPDDGHPRYAIHGGMNALARTVAGQLVANGVTILTERCVTKVTQAGAGWRVSDETGALYTASALVLTPPVPQSLALLDAGDVALASADRAALEAVTYAPCLCALFWLEGKITLPAPGALQRPGTDISWIADNQAKGLSPDATLITLHAGPEYSRQNYDAPDDELLATFQACLQPYRAGRIQTHAAQLKRWRYALPTVIHPERYLLAQGRPPLLFGGDAFGHPRVEGAALSGLAMGNQLAQSFGSFT